MTKEKELHHCKEESCAFYQFCEDDFVLRFLCGEDKKLFKVGKMNSMAWVNIKPLLIEIESSSGTKLDHLAEKYGVARKKEWRNDQYKLLVKYACQEKIRNSIGMQTPARIKETIASILAGYADGIMLQKNEDIKVNIIEEEVTDKQGNKTIVKREVKVSKPNSKSGLEKVWQIVIRCWKAKMSFEDTKKEVLKVHPTSGFNRAGLAWYVKKYQAGEIGNK